VETLYAKQEAIDGNWWSAVVSIFGVRMCNCQPSTLVIIPRQCSKCRQYMAYGTFQFGCRWCV